MEEAIHQLRERFSCMSNDLYIIEKRLDQEFCHVYGHKSHPRRLLYRLQALQKNIQRLSHQSQVLFEAKSELVRVLRQQLNAHSVLSSLQAHVCQGGGGDAEKQDGRRRCSSSSAFLQDVRCQQIYQEGEDLLKRWSTWRQKVQAMRHPELPFGEESLVDAPALPPFAEGGEEKDGDEQKKKKNEAAVLSSSCEEKDRAGERAALSTPLSQGGEAPQHLSASAIGQEGGASFGEGHKSSLLPNTRAKDNRGGAEVSAPENTPPSSSSSSSSLASSSSFSFSASDLPADVCTDRAGEKKEEGGATKAKEAGEGEENLAKSTNCRCGFVPISSSVFTHVPVLTRRRAKLEDVNELYHFLFHSAWDKTKGAAGSAGPGAGTKGKSSSSSACTTSIRELNRRNFTVVGQTGEAKLSTLRYLGLLELHPKQGTLRLVLPNQKGKRKGENDEKFRAGPGVCTPGPAAHQHTYNSNSKPRDLSTKKPHSSFHLSSSSSTPSSSLKKQKFAPHN